MYKPSGDRGFTLIELLVVILIIAILAAIAIPVFLRQRERAMVSQVESALKNAATALESYAIGNNGSFAGVDGAVSDPPNAQFTAVLEANGYRKSSSVTIGVRTAASDTVYCVTAEHDTLSAGHDWERAVYNSTDGAPSPNNADACPGFPPI